MTISSSMARKAMGPAAALLLLAFLYAVCRAVLPGADVVEVVAQLDHGDVFQLFYSGGSHFVEGHSVLSDPIAPGSPQKVRFAALHHVPMQQTRLDLGSTPGSVRLFKMTVAGLFSRDVVLLPADIHRLFSRPSPGTTVRLEKDHVLVQTGEDGHLVCSKPLLLADPLLLFGIPLLFAFCFLVLFQGIDFSQLPPLADLRNPRPSAGENIDALDGLRALAAIMVVADHTWGLFSGLGSSGVWIFMTLSGFLLAKPFVQQPERAVSPAFLRHFLARRLRRILPAYYAYVVMAFLLPGRIGEAALHFLFLKGNGHLWVVPQEMFFYLLTPPIMLLACLLLGGRPLLVVPVLIGLAVLANRHLDIDVVALRGMNNIPLRPYVGVFLYGIAASWLHHGLWQQRVRPELKKQLEPWAAGLVIVLLLFFVLCSEERLWGGSRIFAQLHFPWFGAAAAVLILAVLAAGQSSGIRFLASTPLRAVSLVSFSLYLFHPMLIDLLRKAADLYCGKKLTGLPMFASTLLLSYLFACIVYSLVERPFLRSA